MKASPTINLKCTDYTWPIQIHIKVSPRINFNVQNHVHSLQKSDT